MDFPVRCFTCNKVIANKIETYKKYVEEKMELKEALDKIGAKRYCCRRMFLGYVNIEDKMLRYNNNK
jgi:DNA-directed RNA polymerase I, II, and III subunit RPABC5